MKYSSNFLLNFKCYNRLANEIWQRIGLLGIRKKYRGKRAGRNKHRIEVRISSRVKYGHCTVANRRTHNPLNCTKLNLVHPHVSNHINLPNILLLNARSIAHGKIDELICISNEAVHEIICITETWLDEVVPDEFEFVSLPNYDIIRANRSGKKGGGVAIYVHEALPYRARDDLSNNKDIECMGNL